MKLSPGRRNRDGEAFDSSLALMVSACPTVRPPGRDIIYVYIFTLMIHYGVPNVNESK